MVSVTNLLPFEHHQKKKKKKCSLTDIFSQTSGVINSGSGWRNDVVNKYLEFDPELHSSNNNIPNLQQQQKKLKRFPFHSCRHSHVAKWLAVSMALAYKVNMVLITSTETIRLIRDGGKRGKRGMEVGEEGDYKLYTYRYTATTRMTPALRWAAMRAILMLHSLWGTKSQDSVHRPQLLKRKDSRNGFEPSSSAYLLTSLTLYR